MQSSLLPFFGVVRVSGDDRATFLHNQLSNHIEALADGQACYATYNTPKGRVIANMLVINRGEDLLLVMAADLIESTIKRLRMFVLRAKVVFEALPEFGVAGELADNHAPQPPAEPQLAFAALQNENICRISLPHGGILLVGEQSRLPAYDAAAEYAWQRHEIESGYPWIADASREAAVAQMLNQQASTDPKNPQQAQHTTYNNTKAPSRTRLRANTTRHSKQNITYWNPQQHHFRCYYGKPCTKLITKKIFVRYQ